VLRIDYWPPKIISLQLEPLAQLNESMSTMLVTWRRLKLMILQKCLDQAKSSYQSSILLLLSLLHRSFEARASERIIQVMKRRSRRNRRLLCYLPRTLAIDWIDWKTSLIGRVRKEEEYREGMLYWIIDQYSMTGPERNAYHHQIEQ
jgi:hypothetical protein